MTFAILIKNVKYKFESIDKEPKQKETKSTQLRIADTPIKQLKAKPQQTLGFTSTKPAERFSLGRPLFSRSSSLNHDSSKQKGKWKLGLCSLEVSVFVFDLTRTKLKFLFYTPKYSEPEPVNKINFKIFSDQNATECILQIKIDPATKYEEEIRMRYIVYRLSDLKQKEAGKKTLKARKHTNMDSLYLPTIWYVLWKAISV